MEADWSNLPSDLWSIVGYKLDVGADRIRFRSVSTTLRSSLPFPQPPWLVLSERVDDVNNQPLVPPPRGYVGLGEEHVYELNLPEAHRKRLATSAGTWLITVTTCGIIHLLNPFSRVQIQLPSQPILYRCFGDCRRIVHKVILSSSSMRDCIVVALHTNHRTVSMQRKVAIVRPGDAYWTTIETPAHLSYFGDIVFYNKQIYAVNYNGVVMACDVGDRICPPKFSVLTGRFNLVNIRSADRKLYLVEWMGELLFVVKFMNYEQVVKYKYARLMGERSDSEDIPYYTTKGFHVYRIDFANKKWDELTSLGEYSLFLGQNSSVSVLASGRNRIKKNCIYFTDDYDSGYQTTPTQGGHAMGVFDMESGDIQPHYKGNSTSSYSPPIWLIPSSIYN